MQILGVGIVTLDIINLVDHYPVEDEELRAESQVIRRGGNTANTLTVLSQFNHSCFWAGTIAEDLSTDFIVSDLNKHKINYSLAKKITNSKQPTSYITLNKTNGSRTIVHYRDLPELDFSYFKMLDLENFNWIHFEARAIDEVFGMLQLIKSNFPSIPVSVEIEKPRKHLEKIFTLADLFIYSKAYANSCGFKNPEAFLQSQKLVSPNADLVCTWGKAGASALLKSDQLIHSNAYLTKNTVDTIGAGDTFNAGLIHSRLTKKSWQASLEFSCRLAGKKCGQMGFNNLA